MHSFTLPNGSNLPNATISADEAIEYLLADIPFYSVGLLAFGVLTFFIVLRKLDRVKFAVLLSGLLAFVGAVLDLGRLINRTKRQSVDSIVIGRELGYSAALATRFYFFWLYVALAPRGESTHGRRSWTERSEHPLASPVRHSGEWLRWGVLGLILKHLLLTSVIAVGTLEAVWRMALLFELGCFKMVYTATAIVETTLSALFILKIFGNIWLSPMTPRWKTLRDYLPFVVSVVIELGISIGNMLSFQFSESPLGRFLQAVSLYVLIIYVLIAAFYDDPSRVASFYGSPVEIIGERNSPINVRPKSPEGTYDLSERRGRASTTERVSSWISRRISGRPDPQLLKQWNRNTDIEEGTIISPTTTMAEKSKVDRFDQDRRVTGPLPSKNPSIKSSSSAGSRARRGLPPLSVAIPTVSSASPAIVPSEVPKKATSPTVSDPPAMVRNSLGVPIDPRSAITTDSPVYGLNGIIRRIAALDGAPTQRAITEVDGSRLPTSRVASSQFMEVGSSGTLGTSLNSALLSASGRSEFSLSNFPSPPHSPTSTTRMSTLFPIPPSQYGDNTHGRNDSNASALVPANPGQSGMRLDVTSFIGGYSKGQASLSPLSGIDSAHSSPSDAVIVDIRSFTPKPLNTSSTILPFSASSSTSTMTTSPEDRLIPPVPVLPNGTTVVPPRPVVSLPSNPRPMLRPQDTSPPQSSTEARSKPLTISRPVLRPEQDGAFERPRPAPTAQASTRLAGISPTSNSVVGGVI